MRLLQFYLPGKGPRMGVLVGDQVFDLSTLGVTSTLSLFERVEREGLQLEGYLEELLEKAQGAYSYQELLVPPEAGRAHVLIPIHPPEVWGCGVTYKRSAEARDKDAGMEKGIYDYVYENPRPELFFKATASRCVGPNDYICIRRDSRLTAVEPELAYVLGAEQRILGYTICNDVSAWDLERENPLYLPQAKIFRGCCALGPVIVTPGELRPYDLTITCRIKRGETIYEGSVHSSEIKRTFEELTEYLTRDNPIPVGTVVTTGTGIMVPNEYALRDGDVVEIEIENIGKLVNRVKQL